MEREENEEFKVIGRLTGTITKNDLNSVIVDVNGVGYLVNCSNKTMDKLSDGEVLSLDIETIVREDFIKLYGFISIEEKYWFNTLATVQGVGFKVCIALLNTLTPEEISAAIMSGDKAMLSRADGVGPKLAGRIALELKDKVSDMNIVPGTIATSDSNVKTSDINDAISALTNLGYNRAKAFIAVNSVKEYDDINDLLKKALKELS